MIRFVIICLQISELSDLGDRPLVGALTSRLQALHAQLQAFVERVDSLGKTQTGPREPQVDGVSPTASPRASLLCSGGDQDRQKVTDKHTSLPHSSSPTLSFIYYQLFVFKLSLQFGFFFLSLVSSSLLQFVFSLADKHVQPHLLLLILLTVKNGFTQHAQI